MTVPSARHFPAARVKKIMQSSEDVGRVGGGAQEVVARACELLLGGLARGSVARAEYTTQAILGAGHLKLCVGREPTFDFLKETLAHVPDIEELPEPVKRPGHLPRRKTAPKKPKAPKPEAVPPPAGAGAGEGEGAASGDAVRTETQPAPSTQELKAAAARLTLPLAEVPAPEGGAGALGAGPGSGPHGASDDDDDDYD